MRHLAIVLGVTAVLGCDNSRNVNVSNQNPLGTVGGQVLDVENEMPLSGATVTLQVSGTTLMGTTDASGLFSIPKVPVGSFFATVAATGYQGAYFGATLTGTVGNFPVSNPQMTLPTTLLFKNSGSFVVRLVDDHGAPVAGAGVTARVQVRYFNYGYNGGTQNTLQPLGSYPITAMTDAAGLATLKGMPVDYALNLVNTIYYGSTQVYVDVAPITVTGTQQYQFSGGSYPLNPTKLTHTDPISGVTGPWPVAIITLSGPDAALSILGSSIDFLANKSGSGPFSFTAPVGSVLPVDKPIYVTFNEAIDPKTLRTAILDDNGQPAGITVTQAVDTNIATLTPSANFGPGKRYNLALHADALTIAGQNTTGTREINITAPFFTAGGAAGVSVAPTIDKTVPGASVITLIFSEPVGLGRGISTAQSCVAWYEGVTLHAPDPMNPVFPGEYSTTNPMLCALPRAVDYITDDVTSMTPTEIKNPSTDLMITGFATKWTITTSIAADATGCKIGTAMGANCVRPGQTAGGVTHLLFSKLPGTLTFKRANGQPLADMMFATPN